MIYKTNESTIVIQAEARDQQRSDVVFWSHDRGTAKLRMKLMQKSGVPQTLPEGTTVPIRLTFQSNTAQNGIGKHDYLATIEDKVNGIVSIVLQDNILGYVGIVHGSVYLNFPENKSLDTAGRFSFEIRRSPIDESTPDLEDYYFNGFSQTIDKVEKMIADAKKEIDTKLADTNSKITKANNDLTTLNTNLNKTQTQIGELGTLKRIYSNSIDFGSYDYSGNPNLTPLLKDITTTLNATACKLTKNPDYVTAEKIADGTSDAGIALALGYNSSGLGMFPVLKAGTKYTITVPIKINSSYTGDSSKMFIAFRGKDKNNATLIAGSYTLPANATKDVFTDYKFTITMPTATEGSKSWFIMIDSNNDLTARGSIDVKYTIKLEEGTTATPYQPNLQDAPYYFSKTASNDNVTQYKYFGESLKDSNNPNDYSWDITPEFTESGLNNSVSLTSPQTVLGVKNFKEGLQVNGKSVTTLSDLDKIAITTISNNDGSLSNFNLNGSTFGFGSSMRTTGTVQAFTRNANKQLICNVAGTYVFNGQLSVQTGVPIDGWHYVEIRVNSKVVDLVWARGLQSFKSKWNFSGMIQFNLKAGDVIDFISSSSETGSTSGLFMSCPLATFQRIGD